MDKSAMRDALRTMSPRMRGADIGALVEPVMRAWNDASAAGLRVTAMTAVVDVTWPRGYVAGAAHGHRFVTDYFARTAKQTMAEQGERLDPEGRWMLRAVAGSAVAVAATEPTATDVGPSRNDYLTATGDANGVTDAEEAAIAARVGWMHGYTAGNADAGWSAAGRIVSTVSDLIGAFVMRVDIGGQSGNDWLIRADIGSRTASEHDVWHSRPSAAHAFPPLRQVSAMSTTDPARPTSEGAAHQRQGRSR